MNLMIHSKFDCLKHQWLKFNYLQTFYIWIWIALMLYCKFNWLKFDFYYLYPYSYYFSAYLFSSNSNIYSQSLPVLKDPMMALMVFFEVHVSPLIEIYHIFQLNSVIWIKAVLTYFRQLFIFDEIRFQIVTEIVVCINYLLSIQ